MKLQANPEILDLSFFLNNATKDTLDYNIMHLSTASKDLRNSSENRRICKNILALLKKERKQFND